jgi:hypothetical protein
MLDKEFVPYQEVLELKELGFNEPCFGYYDIDSQELVNDKWMQHPNESTWTINAPTFSQAFRWFRKKYNLIHRIDRDGGWWICAILNLYDEEDQGTIEIYLENCYPNSYEEAELACLKKLIEIVKK